MGTYTYDEIYLTKMPKLKIASMAVGYLDKLNLSNIPPDIWCSFKS
jgi:hypothetical protein